MEPGFSKRYTDAQTAARAAANHEYLAELDADVPRAWIDEGDPACIRMERVVGRHPSCHVELLEVAGAMGRLHARAIASPATALLPGFAEARRVLSPLLSGLDRWETRATELPQAVYKDSNVRNCLLDGTRVIWVDFDDLTRAPVGYDLAKLVVSSTMTNGHPPKIDEMRDVYASNLDAPDVSDTLDAHFGTWLAMHGILTARYVGKHGYRMSWFEVGLKSG